MHIIFVKKLLASGEPCPKCADVEARLNATGQMASIDQVAVADERDAESEGMRLAKRHGVEVAPFFIVEDRGDTTIYTVYLRFAKAVFGTRAKAADEAREVLRANPDLDLI